MTIACYGGVSPCSSYPKHPQKAYVLHLYTVYLRQLQYSQIDPFDLSNLDYKYKYIRLFSQELQQNERLIPFRN